MDTEPKKPISASDKETETLRFWRENSIFEKSLEQTRGREAFVFYDGPPFATGLPHYGHLLASIIKDAIPRYQTMRGKYVPRRWGWDCHGLPIENIVEQKLGLKSKKDIVDYGIDKFNEEAKEEVLRYAKDWKEIIPRVGRWVDMEHDYKTMDPSYTETVWWIFKTLHEKKLIGEGYKAMHLCPRCETTLANFEVALGYKDITDISVTVKFELEDEPGTYVLAWTTTPWTLPGNVALAVGKEIEYVKVKRILPLEMFKEGKPVPKGKVNQIFIVAKEKYEETFSEIPSCEIVGEFKGSDLVGKSYKPPFDYFVNDPNIKNKENGWKIYPADFVTTDDGTGVVHIAPAFGEDDMNLWKEHNLPFIQHVTRDSRFVPEVGDGLAGLHVKPKGSHQATDVEVLKLLDAKGVLFSKESYKHSYPHCWRCETPLLNYAASSWFVHVTKIKNDLIANNKQISWIPEHIKEGRFGKGLETAPDWAISRSRFWGAPLPVWKCESCKRIEVAGSLEDLEKKRHTKPTMFLLVRHGEREDVSSDIMNDTQRHGEITLVGDPQAEVHISEAGKKVIRGLAERLKNGEKVDAIYASPYLRTKETAEVFSRELGIPVVYDDRIQELQHGTAFEGRKVAEYYAYFEHPIDRFTKVPEGGESLNQVRERMMSFVREIAASHEGKRILVISHGDPLWMLEGAFKNMTNQEILESRAAAYIRQGEMREIPLKNYPYNRAGEIDFHRPYIDEIRLACECGAVMNRIPEVFDCWFESGSMPYGEVHYTGSPLSDFDPESAKGFPADFIAEGLDQTRGWFYSLHVLAGALFGMPAYKHVLVNGIILAEDGQKMSKRLKNYPDPMEVVAHYGADAMRWYLLASPAVYAEDLNFSENGVDEISKKIIARLENVHSFYSMYSNVPVPDFTVGVLRHVLDQYIAYELKAAARAVSQAVESYRLDRAVRAAGDFIDILSTVYIQYSRDRFKEGEEGRSEALSTLRYVIIQLSKVIAPFAPFLAERLYQQIKGENGKESVHLEPWPEFDASIDSYAGVSEEMERVRKSVEAILAARSLTGLSVRQPLASCAVRGDILPEDPEFREIVMKRTNIETLEEKQDAYKGDAWRGTEDALVNTELTEDLLQKGVLRELVRSIQDARKKAGLTPEQKTVVEYSGGEKEQAFIARFRDDLKKSVGASDFEYIDMLEGYAIQAGDLTLTISFRI